MALLERIRLLYLERGNGVVDVGTTALHMRDGELMLDRSDPHAIGFGGHLPADGSFAGDHDVVRRRIVELAHSLASDQDSARESKVRGAVELVGPLPTVYLLLELATYQRDHAQLLESLGGARARFRSRSRTPALEQLPGLDPEMGQVLACLERPMPIRSLLRSVDLEPLSALRALARLWAVGLVGSAREQVAQEERPGLLSTRGLEHFRKTIGESLSARPLELTADEHRQRVIDTWQKLGELNSYQLLQIESRADDEKIHTAYSDVARLVHPSHAEHLGFEGRDEILKVLFERVTEAYLTLSDAGRRVAYDQLLGLQAPVAEVAPEKRAAEKADVALDLYRRGIECLSARDISVAVDLLKEASRLDPQPEHLATLGLAQAKNPAWRRHAIASYRRALELEPKNVKYLLGLAAVLEKMERGDQALEHYRRILELEPSNHQAKRAVERLEDEPEAEVAVDSDAEREVEDAAEREPERDVRADFGSDVEVSIEIDEPAEETEPPTEPSMA